MKKIACSTREIARMFGYSPGSLSNMRGKKIGPIYYKRGKKVVYFIEDFTAWVKEKSAETSQNLMT